MAETQEQVAQKCLSDFYEDLKVHELWADKVDEWYRAWRGVVDRNSGAGQWRSQLFPPYLLQIIETLAAGLIDPNPRWRVSPRPRQDSIDDIEFISEAGKGLENLLSYQRDADDFSQKQRPHRLQGLIAGATAWKTYWDWEKQEPCAEVVDMRDLIIHEAATSVENAQRITHRVYKSFDELKELEKQGIYKGVDKVKEARSISDQQASREQDLFNQNRTKDLIEVLECWIEGGKRVVTIANGKVLADKPNPFDHGQYPFIVCSPIPDLFRVHGVSVVELVQDLQEMLWSLQNRRMDSLEVVANAIVLIRDDALNPDSFIFAPGEQWLVPDKDAVTIWQPDVRSAQVTLDAEALIKADIQNIPGASPALLGQTEQTEQTATEVSLLTNLAQRRLAAQKHQFVLADVKVADHWLELNRQYLDEPRYIGVVGSDGEEGWELISPEDFAPYQWKINVEQMDESLVRQERRAEAQAKLQVALAAVPVFAAVGVPLNIQAFMEDYLEAFGVDNKERYFSQQPQPAALGQGQPPGPPGMPGMAPEGATAPQAVDANSPSNQFSQSPVAMMQRMLASTGGEVNV